MRCFTALLVLSMLCLVGCGAEDIEEGAERALKGKSAGDLRPSTATLDFLSDVWEFRQLHSGTTEDELKSLITANDLSATVSEKDGDKSYHVYRRDGENVIVMFREGKCSGVQRMRRDVSGVPRQE